MTEHNKETFTKEYLLCRRIPYRWRNGGQLEIGEKGRKDVIFCIYNLPWAEIVPTIDRMVEYDEFGRYVRLKIEGRTYA